MRNINELPECPVATYISFHVVQQDVTVDVGYDYIKRWNNAPMN